MNSKISIYYENARPLAALYAKGRPLHPFCYPFVENEKTTASGMALMRGFS